MPSIFFFVKKLLLRIGEANPISLQRRNAIRKGSIFWFRSGMRFLACPIRSGSTLYLLLLLSCQMRKYVSVKGCRCDPSRVAEHAVSEIRIFTIFFCKLHISKLEMKNLLLANHFLSTNCFYNNFSFFKLFNFFIK